jgi:hypothetical protein
MSDQPSNSALEVKLDYLQRDIREIKSDVKEIKNDYVSRREFESRFLESDNSVTERFKPIKEDVSFLKKVVYSTAALIISTLLIAAINFFVNK